MGEGVGWVCGGDDAWDEELGLGDWVADSTRARFESWLSSLVVAGGSWGRLPLAALEQKGQL